MAGQIDANYASPGLRWGLLLEDHPGATYEFAYSKGSDIPKVGVPAEYGGDKAVCVATIAFPPSSGLVPVVAYKTIPAEGTPDEWNVLCTKTLGRALKKAGYPDNLVDLKALVLWRQRNAEVEAITAQAGSAPLQLGRGEAVVAALEEAATSTPDGRGGGDDDAESNVAPHPETLAALREAFGDLTKAQQEDAEARATARDTDLLNPTDEEQAQRIVAWLRHLAEGGGDDATVTAEVVDDDDEVPPGVDAETGELVHDDVATVAELIVGLDRNAKKLFDGYCKTIGAPTDPTKMTPDHLFAVLEWFASDDEEVAS